MPPLDSWIADADVGRWEDLQFPATAINPLGGAADADRDVNTGLLLFDAGSTEVVAAQGQFPHGRKYGSQIEPHVHCYATTDPGGTGDVVWQWEYKWYNVDGLVPAAYTALTTTDTLSDDVGGLKSIALMSFGRLDGTDMGDSSIVEWKLSRLGGDSADTYAADVVMVSFDIHYLRTHLGSKLITGDLPATRWA